MTNGLRPTKITVNIETMPSFSASIADMRISPVTRVILGTPEADKKPVRLEVSIVGKCGEKEFLKRCDFVKDCFFADSFNLKNSMSCVLDFDFDSFEYNYAFLNSIEQEVLGELYVLVKYGTEETVAKTHISLLPGNVWTGLDGEPAVVASFIRDNDDSIETICSNACEGGKISYSINSKKSIVDAVKALYKSLKECNIIYSRPAGYAANAKQWIRYPDELFGAGSILATPLEISLVFCACIKKIGFDSSLIFVRGKKGEISVLCGVYLIKSPIKVPVCEDAERIRSLVDAGDMLIVDPSVFAAAQNTSFMMALEKTAEGFVTNSQSLVCLVDIKRALLSVDLYAKEDNLANIPAKNAVAKIYSSLASSSALQFLSGRQRREVEEIPLLLPDFDKAFSNVDERVRLLPLDINVHLDDFAAVDKDFSSILTMFSPMARQHFSSSEIFTMKQKLEKFREKVTRDKEYVTSLRDEELYRAASEMTFGKNKKEPYFAFGYVKITDKLTESVSFAPICLVRAKIEYESGNFFVSQVGKPIVNKVFIRNALRDSSLGYDSFMKALMPTDKKEIFDMFDNFRMALAETDDRHIYEIVKESHIINIDIDDYVLWSNLALERGKLSQHETVRRLFSDEHVDENINKEYVPAKPMFSAGMKAVCANTDVVVEGAFSEEKEMTFSSIAQRNIAEGLSTLVVTDDMEMSRYVERVLGNDGLQQAVYVVDENCMAKECARRISDNIDEYSGNQDASDMLKDSELSEADSVLCDYAARISKNTSLGMSLREAVEAYLDACSGTEGYDDVFVDKSIFANADEQKLSEIFDVVAALVTEARKVCRMSGLEKHTPLKNHPLYHANPAPDIDENERNAVCIAIESALPVISEYRDVFSDVNEILKFDETEIDSLYKLEKLNDLYKLVLTARDVDIPEKFVESDIEVFSRNKRFESENKKRMEAIEFKLNFFNHEIFEDVETLLVGDEYDEDNEEKGFLRKLMIKKNSQDLLMQYIEADKKAEFQQHKIPDIYRLLYEYKSCVVNLKEAAAAQNYDEDTAKLAGISEKALYLVDAISSSETNKKYLLSNIFRLISVIPIDSSLARRITVARARFAELYSGEISPLGVVSKTLGINFDDVVFERGALSFDGLGKYLESVEEKIEVTDLWAEWKQKSAAAAQFVPEFVRYLDEHGALANVDRIFAKSLLMPVAENIRESCMKDFSDEKLARAKEKYTELLDKACELSKKNTFESYKNSVKQMAQTTEINSNVYEKVSFRDFYTENRALIHKVLPVVVVTKNMLTEALPLETVFDTVVVIDNRNNGYSMLPALCFGKRCVLLNMSRAGRSELCERMAGRVPCYDVSRITSGHDVSLFTWLNSGFISKEITNVGFDESSTVELVRMNGIYDRTSTRTNLTEAEHSMVKASNLLQNPSAKVALTAFTKEQCTSMERLLHIVSKKNAVIDAARREGRVSVCTPDRLYMKEYDSLVVCACFGADKDARIGWDFGYAGISLNEAVPEAYISIADRKTDKTYFLTSLNVKDSRVIRRTGKNAAIFNSFCEMLNDFRIPVNMSNAKVDNNEGILKGLMASINSRNPKVKPCEGKYPVAHAFFANEINGPFVLIDNDLGSCMHDELLIKKRLEEMDKLTVTLTPMSLTGSKCKETVKSLVEDRENI